MIGSARGVHPKRVAPAVALVIGFVALTASLGSVALRAFFDGGPERAVAIQSGNASPEVASPFASDEGDQSLALGVRLIGVRVSQDATPSGAVIALPDGSERAFLIGEDVAPGVSVITVQIDQVVLGSRGGRAQVLTLDGVTRAEPAVSAPAAPTSGGPPRTAPGVAVPEAAAWLAVTLTRPEESLGPSPGWRVRPPLPDASAAAGLQVGDMIVSINGIGPNDLRGARAAADDSTIVLSVRRSTGEQVTVVYPVSEAR
jgi:type II secretory pathway component PulC